MFGEVLFDCFPDGSTVLGGAPFNVAWNLRGFGLDPLLISRVGNDDRGREIRSAMAAWKLKTDGVQIDADHATGTVEVRLEEGQPRFEILADQAYDFIEAGAVPVPEAGDLVVHGTLALRRSESRAAFDRLMETPGVSSFYDVNLRSPWWDLETVTRRMRRADTVKLADEELVYLTPGLNSLSQRVDRLLEVGPRLVCLTRGEKGAAVYSRDGCLVDAEPEKGIRVVDTVGAGDAFSSVLILGRLRNWGIETTTRRAVEFAGAVVGQRGATVRDEHFYHHFLEVWSRS